MDYLSIQERKSSLDDAIYRAVLSFEKDTGSIIQEIKVNHLDNHCTGISTRLQTWQT